MFSRLYHFSYLLVAFYCTTSFLTAQVNNFQPGYYIQLGGDTISANINQEGDLYLSKFIKTRKGEEGETMEIRPIEITGFGFSKDGLHYKRVLHQYETKGGEKIEIQRFARRLVKGFYSLYRLEQFAGEFVRELSGAPAHTYYLENQEGNIFKLEQVEETVTGTKYRILDRWKGVMKYLMQDWAPISDLADKAMFKDMDVSDIVAGYNRFRMPNETISKANVSSSRNYYHRFRLALPVANLNGEPSLQSGFGGGYSFHLFNPRFSNSVTIGIGIEFIRTSYGKRDVIGFVDDIGGEVVTAINFPIMADYYLSRQGNIKPKIKLLLSPSITKINAAYVSSRSIQVGGSNFVQRSVEMESSTSPVLYYGLGIGLGIADFEINIRADRSLFFQLEGPEESLNGSINVMLGVEYSLGKRN